MFGLFQWIGFFCLSFFIIGAANAGSFTVSPINLYLDKDKNITSFDLTNKSNTTTTIQIKILKWQQNNGIDVYDKTQDIIVTPVIFSIPPNTKQVVRIGLRQPINNTSEATYRIISTELPINSDNKDAPKANNGIKMLLQINMPLFITPLNVVQKIDFQVKKDTANKLTVNLINNGNVHAQITELSVYDANNRLANKEINSRILAGQSAHVVLSLTTPLTNKQVKIIAKEVDPDGKSRELNELVSVS